MADINFKILLKSKRFWAGILLAQFLLFFFLSKSATAVKFFEDLFEIQKSFHQKIFAGFSFSVGDFFYVIIGLFLITILFGLFKSANRSRPLLIFLIFLNSIYFIYQFFWGMLYFQKPLVEKLPMEDVTLEETKTLALKYLEKCKQSRKLVKEDKNGVFKIYNLSEVENTILYEQKRLPSLFNLKKATTINSFKESLYKDVMSFTGIYGYYNPFTAEAQYNPNLPSLSLPFTIAHESAHQLGYAREQEANFIGYLIGKNTLNPELRYSTEYYVLRSLLWALSEKNEDFVNEVLDNFSEGMKRDRLFEKNFAEKHSGLLTQFFAFTNDLFLKSNQQEGSVTYSYFTDLLIRYERSEMK